VALPATFDPEMTAVEHRQAVSSTARNAWRHSFGTNGFAVGAPSLPGGAASRLFQADRHEKDHS
jgi:hypothetical protein